MTSIFHGQFDGNSQTRRKVIPTVLFSEVLPRIQRNAFKTRPGYGSYMNICRRPKESVIYSTKTTTMQILPLYLSHRSYRLSQMWGWTSTERKSDPTKEQVHRKNYGLIGLGLCSVHHHLADRVHVFPSYRTNSWHSPSANSNCHHWSESALVRQGVVQKAVPARSSNGLSDPEVPVKSVE